jgi:hypothetical protein
MVGNTCRPRGACATGWLLILLTACYQNAARQMPGKGTMPSRDINEVLRDHDRELMKIPGVVGIYVGLAEDGITPCLRVMVDRKTPELEKKIPKSLEGYRVLVDETGTIRPFNKK